MPDALLGGTRAFWRSWGNGPRRALALHCSLAHSGAWQGVAAHLPGTLRIDALDLPGHGRSGPRDPARDYLEQSAAMALDLIGDDPVDLIGHSFGAVVCLAVALARPGQVRALVLYEPVFFAAAMARGYDAAPLRSFEPAILRGDPATAAQQFHALWGDGPEWASLPQRQREAHARRMDLIAAASPALYDDRSALLAPGRLDALAAPVLLLDGTRSPPVTAAIDAALADVLPNARRATLPGLGHMGPLTHPAEVAARIRAHLGL